MNARVVADPEERLQPDRLPGVFAVVRIQRGERVVDLTFLRRTKQLYAIAVSDSSGAFARAYDRFSISSPERMIDIADQLLAL